MTIDLIDPTTPLPELLPEVRFRGADDKQERGRLRGAPLPPTSWDEALKIAYKLSPSQDRELRSAVWSFLRWECGYNIPTAKTPLQVHSDLARIGDNAVLADVRTAETLGALGLVRYAVNHSRAGARRARLYVITPRGYQVGLIAILAWRPTSKVKPGAAKKAAEMMASEVSPTRAADLATRLLSKDGLDDVILTYPRLFRGLHRLGLVRLRRNFGKLQAGRERLAAAATPAFGQHLAEILGPAGMEQLLTME